MYVVCIKVTEYSLNARAFQSLAKSVDKYVVRSFVRPFVSQ